MLGSYFSRIWQGVGFATVTQLQSVLIDKVLLGQSILSAEQRLWWGFVSAYITKFTCMVTLLSTLSAIQVPQTREYCCKVRDHRHCSSDIGGKTRSIFIGRLVNTYKAR